MLRVYIKGKLEFFKDVDDLVYMLRTEYDIDLGGVVLTSLSGAENSLGEIENSLDQLGYETALEKLDEIKEFIKLEKRMSKANKEKLYTMLKEVEENLDEHVGHYRALALSALEDIEL